MRSRSRAMPLVVGTLLSLAGCCGAALAITPGVDIAVPRVLIVTVDSALAFHPSASTLEQGDYVRWSALVSSLHTTTSGSPCLADGLWSASLGTIGTNFDRQFIDTPARYPYFCSPHCGLGMTGAVTVTGVIDVAVNDSAGTTTLSWSGGGGLYKVARSDNPAFTGPNTPTFAPDGGGGGTKFTDLFTWLSLSGSGTYYLVLNQ